ncbi:MAG: glycosyltransferase [Sedimenticola sp.]
MDMPLVSVCIPVFNAGDYIAEAIESVLRQTYANIELLVIDNASTDNTVEVVKRFTDARLKLVLNDRNYGAEANWNKCLDLASGKYVKLLPADDYIYPDCIEIQVEAMESLEQSGTRAVLVYGGREVINGKGDAVLKLCHKHRGLIKGQELIRRNLLSGTNIIGPPGCVLFRADAAAEVGEFDITHSFVIDLDYWFRLLLIGPGYSLGRPVSAFRISEGSWTVSMGRKQSDSYIGFVNKLSADPRFRFGKAVELVAKGRSILNMLLRVVLATYIIRRSR